jgi:hypothetical protein
MIIIHKEAADSTKKALVAEKKCIQKRELRLEDAKQSLRRRNKLAKRLVAESEKLLANEKHDQETDQQSQDSEVTYLHNKAKEVTRTL